MDAPEMKQSCGTGDSTWTCGAAAKREMQRLVGSATTCTAQGRDKYQRRLVRCGSSGRDIGAEMVRAGYAVAYGDYDREEAEAKAARRGIWAGPFERPADWRKRNRLLAPAEDREEETSSKVHWSLGWLGDSLLGN